MSFSHAKNIGLTQTEEDQLRALVYRAYDLRGTPEAVKACQDIVDWYQTRTARNQPEAEGS